MGWLRTVIAGEKAPRTAPALLSDGDRITRLERSLARWRVAVTIALVIGIVAGGLAAWAILPRSTLQVRRIHLPRDGEIEFGHMNFMDKSREIRGAKLSGRGLRIEDDASISLSSLGLLMESHGDERQGSVHLVPYSAEKLPSMTMHGGGRIIRVAPDAGWHDLWLELDQRTRSSGAKTATPPRQ